MPPQQQLPRAPQYGLRACRPQSPSAPERRLLPLVQIVDLCAVSQQQLHSLDVVGAGCLRWGRMQGARTGWCDARCARRACLVAPAWRIAALEQLAVLLRGPVSSTCKVLDRPALPAARPRFWTAPPHRTTNRAVWPDLQASTFAPAAISRSCRGSTTGAGMKQDVLASGKPLKSEECKALLDIKPACIQLIRSYYLARPDASRPASHAPFSQKSAP